MLGYCSKIQEILSGENALANLNAMLYPNFIRFNYDKVDGQVVRVTLERQKVPASAIEHIPCLTYVNGITFERLPNEQSSIEQSSIEQSSNEQSSEQSSGTSAKFQWRVVCVPFAFLPPFPGMRKNSPPVTDDAPEFDVYRMVDGVILNLYFSHLSGVWKIGTSNCADIGDKSSYGRAYKDIFNELVKADIVGSDNETPSNEIVLNKNYTYSFVVHHPELKWSCGKRIVECYFMGAHNNETTELVADDGAMFPHIPRQQPVPYDEIFQTPVRLPVSAASLIRRLTRLNSTNYSFDRVHDGAPHYGWILRWRDNPEHGYMMKSNLMKLLEKRVYNMNFKDLTKHIAPENKSAARRELTVLRLVIDAVNTEKNKELFPEYAVEFDRVIGKLQSIAQTISARLRSAKPVKILTAADNPRLASSSSAENGATTTTAAAAEDSPVDSAKMNTISSLDKLFILLLSNRDIQKLNPFSYSISNSALYDFIRNPKYFDILANLILEE